MMRFRFITFMPLAGVAAGILLFNAAGIALHLWTSAPKDSWDAGLTVEAARHLRGLAIYSDPVLDQASTMYGPVMPILTSWLFHIFGISNIPGKAVSLAASLGIVGLVLAATARRHLHAWLIGAALLFACNHNVAFYFVAARPDMLAILFGLLALFSFAEWERRHRPWVLTVSLLLFVLAFVTKQPLAAAALVPFVAEACRGGGASRHRIAAFGAAILPVVAVMIAIVCLYETSPMAYFYMVTLPRRYGVHLTGAARIAFELLLVYAPVLFVMLDLVANPGRWPEQTRWWAAATGVFLVAGIVTMAKDGGWHNSLLPFYIASAGLLTLQLPRACAALDNSGLSIARRLALAGTLAAVLISFAVRRPGEALSGVLTIQGDARYEDVVALARELRGRVLCPEDPSIPLLARGEITRSAVFEMDVSLWPKQLPAYVDRDISSAQYVIQIKGPYQRLVTDESLMRLGFAPVRVEKLEESVYRLWGKVS